MAGGSAVALPTLEAIRTLSHPRAGYSTKALESAELLVSGSVADEDNGSISITSPSPGSQAIAGVGVIVVRWAINVINGVLKRGKEKDEKAGDATEARRALENVRLWKVLSAAIRSISEGKSASGAAGVFQLASTQALCQALSIAMFPPSPSAEVLVSREMGGYVCVIFAFLATGRQPSPSSVPTTLGTGTGPLSLVPVERFLEVVEEMVEGLSRAPEAGEGTGAGLVTMALQHLTRLQVAQTNQRKGFTAVVERLLEPLLALSVDPAFKSVRELRRAVEGVVSEVVLHREHMEGLRTLLGAGGKGHGRQGNKRKRKEAKEGAEGEDKPEGEAGEAAGSNKWTGYQVLLLDKVDDWVNGKSAQAVNGHGKKGAGKDEDGRRVLVIRAVLSLFQAFVRRAVSLATGEFAEQQQQRQRAAPPSGASSGEKGNAQQEGEKEVRTLVLSASVWAKPMFLLGLRLWGVLWRKVGQAAAQGGQEEAARAVTARALLEALADKDVYKYDSDVRGAEEFKALTELMGRLMDSAREPKRSNAVLQRLSEGDAADADSSEDEDEGEEDEEEKGRRRSARKWVVEPLEAEVACVALVLRIDHRVVSERVTELVGLLARRCHVLGRAAGTQAHVVTRCRQRCVSLMGDVAATYGKLRQVQALLEAVLQAREGGEEQEEAVEGLLRRRDCQGSLARVIRDSPSPLLGPLFDVLRAALSEEGGTAVRVVVRLLVVFLSNVKVSATNAKELREKALETLRQLSSPACPCALSLHAKRFRSQAPLLASLALELAGWLLQTLIICQYWTSASTGAFKPKTGEADTDEEAEGVGVVLKDLLAMGEERIGLQRGERRALDRLLVARMRQLNQEMAEGGANLGTVGALGQRQAEEMRGLVTGLLSGDGCDLELLASCLSLWVRHCEAGHVDGFWRALLQEASVLQPSGAPHAGEVRAILADAELYEMPRLPEALYRVWAGLITPPLLGEELAEEVLGLESTALLASLVDKVLDPQGDKGKGKDKDKDGNKKEARVGKLARKIRKQLSKRAGDEVGVAELRKVLQVVKLLNSLPTGYLPSESQPPRFLLSVLLQHACGLLVSTAGGDQGAMEVEGEGKPASSVGELAGHVAAALDCGALQALRGDVGSVATLLLDRCPQLLHWLVGGHGASSREMVGPIMTHLLEGGREVAVGRLLGAAEVAMGGKKKGASFDVLLLFELVRPFLAAGVTVEAAGREALVGLLRRCKARVAEAIEEMGSDALRLGAAVLELEGREREEGEEGEAWVEDEVIETVLEAGGAAGQGGKEFLAACVRWKGPRGEDGEDMDIEGGEKEEKVDDEEDDDEEEEGIGEEAEEGAEEGGEAMEEDEEEKEEEDEDEEDENEQEEEEVVGGIAARALAALLEAEVDAEPSMEGWEMVVQAVVGSGHRLLGVAVGKLVARLGAPETAGYESACRILTRLVERVEERGDVAGKAVLGAKGRQTITALVHALPRLVTMDGYAGAAAAHASLELLQHGLRKRWLSRLTHDEVVAVLGALSTVPLLFTALPSSSTSSAPTRPVTQEMSGHAERVFGEVCGSVSLLLKHYARVLYVATPPLFVLVRSLLRTLASSPTPSLITDPQGGKRQKAKRRKVGHGSAGPTIARLGVAAAKSWVRMAEHMSAQSHAPAFRKPLIRILADYVTACCGGPQDGAGGLEPELREALLPGIYAVLTIMTPFDVDHLHAACLDPAGQSVFRKLHGDFQSQHRYKGKV